MKIFFEDSTRFLCVCVFFLSESCRFHGALHMSGPRDPRRDADQYIAKHRIDALFQELGTRLVYARAEEPNQFLLEVSCGYYQNWRFVG